MQEKTVTKNTFFIFYNFCVQWFVIKLSDSLW